MKRYDKYKATNITWLPEVPAHWGLIRFGSVFKRKPAINRPEEELLSVFLDRGVIKAVESDKRTHQASEDLGKYQLVEPGDFVMNNQQAWRGSVGVSDYVGIISPAYHIFPMPECFDAHYANYLLRDRVMVNLFDICSKGVGSIQRTLNFNWLNNGKCLLPPIEEQKKIVAFLDKQLALIDSCKVQKEKQVQTLLELKQAEISSVISHGLNPNVSTKESGIFWMPRIPETWTVTKLKHILTKLDRPRRPNDELLICSNSGEVKKRGDSRLGLVADSEEIYQGVRKDDLLIHGMDTWHGAIAVSDYEGMCTPVVHVCDSTQNKEFVAYYLRNMAYEKIFKLISNGVRQNTSDFRSWGKVGTILIPLPPIEEQDSIVQYIKSKTEKIDRMVNALSTEIDLLIEYKQRLISDVVTGQIDIRDEVIA